MSALEQSFAALIEAHDLTALEVSAVKYADGGMRFRTTAHWDGFSRTGNACVLCRGDTIAEALAKLFDEVRLLRTLEGAALADEPLPVEG